MTTKQTQAYSSKLEMLDALAETLLLPEKFTQVGSSYVGTEPVKSSERFSYEGNDYVNNDGVVIRLNLPEQLYLDGKIAEIYGIRARHGSLRENLAGAHSEEAGEYRKNVLAPYWVFTGEVIRRLGEAHDVSKATGVEFVKAQPGDILLERGGRLLETENDSERIAPKINLGPVLQNTIPSKSGYYTNFSDIIPVDDELGSRSEESKGYFGGIYFDKQGLSAVRCAWDSDDGVLFVHAGWPLDGLYGGVLGVFEDENPKR